MASDEMFLLNIGSKTMFVALKCATNKKFLKIFYKNAFALA